MEINNVTPRLAPAALLSALLFGCSGLDVKRDYDASFDFGRLKTYAWRPEAPKGPGVSLADDSLVSARVHGAVDAALAQKGYQAMPAGSDADFRVACHYAVDADVPSRQVAAGIGVGMGAGGVFGGLGLGLGLGSDAREGEWEALSIDLLAPRDGKLLWRGFTRQRLERSSDPKESAAKINAAVRAILSKFPPKPNRP